MAYKQHEIDMFKQWQQSPHTAALQAALDPTVPGGGSQLMQQAPGPRQFPAGAPSWGPQTQFPGMQGVALNQPMGQAAPQLGQAGGPYGTGGHDPMALLTSMQDRYNQAYLTPPTRYMATEKEAAPAAAPAGMRVPVLQMRPGDYTETDPEFTSKYWDTSKPYGGLPHEGGYGGAGWFVDPEQMNREGMGQTDITGAYLPQFRLNQYR